jgi:hypothetical protein
MTTLHKLRIALAVTLLALAAVSAVDSASAQSTYRVTTDDSGDVAGYERVRRFNRGEAD